VRTAFWLIVAGGIAGRVVAGTYSLGFVHPDEHQQYLEAAQGFVHGYNVVYWEYERGVRHCLYPGVLAGLICLFDLLNLRDPVWQAMVLRSFLGVAVFVSIMLVAHDWLRGRSTAALCLIAMAAFSPDMVYTNVRTLSGTAMVIPLILGYLFWKRAPFVAGILFGVMFAVRFQSAFLTGAFFALTFLEDWGSKSVWFRGRTFRLAIGLVLALLCMGWIDKITWGAWFHAPVQYFQAQILEGKAASFGVDPWYRYLEWGGFALFEAGPVLLLLLLVGARRDPQLAFVAAAFFVGHSVIGHKEARFLWPMLPILLLLIATGLEVVCEWLRQVQLKRFGLALLVCLLVPGAWARFADIDWTMDPTRANSLALARTGTFPDVTGVAVFGIPDWECGNYFFLRRKVPLVTSPYVRVIRNHPRWRDGTVNYLVTEPKNIAYFGESRVELLEVVCGWGIYRVNRAGREAGEHHARLDGHADLPGRAAGGRRPFPVLVGV
jgi:hypothetical protein